MLHHEVVSVQAKNGKEIDPYEIDVFGYSFTKISTC